MSTISELAKEQKRAEEMGLSYGQYQALKLQKLVKVTRISEDSKDGQLSFIPR